jgi:hypothetical protein
MGDDDGRFESGALGRMRGMFTVEEGDSTRAGDVECAGEG